MQFWSRSTRQSQRSCRRRPQQSRPRNRPTSLLRQRYPNRVRTLDRNQKRPHEVTNGVPAPQHAERTHFLLLNPQLLRRKHKNPRPGKTWPRVLLGVTDGTRTRDTQDHNLVLYQLNYSHHYRIKGAVFSAHLCSELYGSPQWAGNKNSRSTRINLGKGGVWVVVKRASRESHRTFPSIPCLRQK